jgi:Tol biopolymer transport system component
MSPGIRPFTHAFSCSRTPFLLLALGVAGLRGALGIAHANDAFADRIVKEGISWSDTGNTRGATKEVGEPNHFPGGTGRSLWWTWTSPEAGIVSVYTPGDPPSNLTRIASASFIERTTGSCTFMATQGANYRIGIDSPDLRAGVIDFTLRQPIGAPEIVSPPADLVVGRADPAELSAAIGGSLPIHFQWYFGEQPIPGATNATLLIASALESNIGTYHLCASNALGSVITPAATLGIATNWIEIVPATLTVLEGNRASFSVRRNGFTNALSVQLAFSGSAVAGVDHVPLLQTLNFSQGQTNITLTYQTLDDPDEEPTRTMEIQLVPDPRSSAVTSPLLVIQQQDDDPNIRLSTESDLTRRFDPRPARVLFQRTGNLDRTLTVPFGVTGSARPGLDFASPPNPVVFRPGQSVVEVPFLALPDIDPTDRTLVVTAEPEANATYLLRAAPIQIDVIANRAPRVQLTSPEMWSSVALARPVVLSAIAEDPDGFVSRVEFLEGTRLIASQGAAPFATEVALSPGIHLVRARAIDNRGASTETEPVSVVVEASPVTEGRLSAAALTGFRESGSPTANGGSWGAEASSDPGRVAFTSTGSDLSRTPLPQTALGTYSQVWIHELGTGSNFLASATQAGLPGNGDSITVAGGLRGDWLVFQSEADNLTTIDGNRSPDLFARHVRTRELVLLSARASSTDITGNGPSENPILDRDGKRVVFESRASNLVHGDSNGVSDIFVRALPGSSNRLVSVNSTGTGPGNAPSHSAVLSPDGRRVAFISNSTNLVPNLPVLRSHVFVHDLDTSVTRCISAALPELLTDRGVRPVLVSRYRCQNASLSADGRFIAFKAAGDNPTDPNLILRHDWDSGSTEVLTTTAVQTRSLLNDDTTSALSLDGQVIAYETTNHVRVWNGRAGSDTTVSVRADGSLPATGWARSPTLSPDGETVAFLSSAPELTQENVSGQFYLYARSVRGGPLTLVSRSATGVPIRATGTATWLSGSGQVLFTSDEPDEGGNDLNSASDVFLRDSLAGTTRLISRRHAQARTALPHTEFHHPGPALSADRSRLAVVTSAAMDPADTNRLWDVYLWDRKADTFTLASVNTNGRAASSLSWLPAISGDGRIVAFLSRSADLAPMDTNGIEDVFVRDFDAGRTVLVSSNRFGTTSPNSPPVTSGPWPPVLSHDGEWVGFVSHARDLVPESTLGPNLYLRQWRTGRLVRVVNAFSNRSSKIITPLHLTGSGIATYVHSSSAGLDLFVSDTTSNRHFSHGPLLSRPVVTPDGRFAAYVLSTSGQPVHVFDQVAWTNITAGRSLPTGNPAPDSNRTDVDISNDGRRVAFVSSRSLDPLDTNATNDVYVFELPGGSTRLASGNRFGSGVGNAAAWAPRFSPDGRFLLFRSQSTNLMPGTVSGESLYVRDLESNLLWRVACIQRGPGRGAYPGNPFWDDEDVTLFFRSLTIDSTAHVQTLNPPLLSFALPASLTSDVDSDGMDDAWEWKWFGSQTRTGGDDWDQDGVLDRDEFLTGMDPTRKDTPLTLVLAEPDPDGVIVLQWPASTGRRYDVLATDDLGSTEWQVLSVNVEPSGGIGTFRIDTRERSHRYFRIAAKP